MTLADTKHYDSLYLKLKNKKNSFIERNVVTSWMQLPGKEREKSFCGAGYVLHLDLDSGYHWGVCVCVCKFIKLNKCVCFTVYML